MNPPPPLKRLLPWAIVAICAVLVLLLAQRHRDLTRGYSELRRNTSLLRAGDVVPTFAATALDGAGVTIGATGTPDARQVLFLFRTTCPYCAATLPVWRRIADSLRRVGTLRIQVLAISLDSAAPSRAYARGHQLPYPVVLFPERKLARLYRVAATPQTLVLNAEGLVLYAHAGLLDNPAVVDSVLHAATAPPRAAADLPLAPATQAVREPGG